MDWLTVVYLFYTFIALYFLFLFIVILIPRRGAILNYPQPKKIYDLSIVVPCYNEEKDIAGTIESLLKIKYPGLKRIIVVDDCSTDSSYSIIQKYAKKYPTRILVLQTPKHTGKASGAKNYGAKYVKTELIGFTDADSYPEEGAIEKMIGFFDDQKTGAVTSMVLVKHRTKFIEKLQAIEYKIIAFSRKLLGFVDAIYVTPGPLAVYRRSAFEKIGGFDEKNMTEDIEITWSFVNAGYKVEMCASARVYTVAPSKFKDWFRQRVRWNYGGIQTISKYRKTFLKKNMLGCFILPFFIFSWFLGIAGLFVLIYRFITGIISKFLSATYSVQAQTAIVSLKDISLTPNVLFFFGLVLLLLSLAFTFIALSYSPEKEFKKYGIFSVMGYMFVYLLAYPFILVTSVYKYSKSQGKGLRW